MNKPRTALAAATAFLAACASDPADIAPAYVPASHYARHNCQAIATEMASVERRTYALYHKLQDESDADAGLTMLGMLGVWPLLFMLDGDGPEAQEYAYLKGEFNALQMAARQKGCNLNVASPEETMKSLGG